MDKKMSQQQKPERKKEPQLRADTALDDELTDEQIRTVSGGHHGAPIVKTNS
jgi:hypothetical protein